MAVIIEKAVTEDMNLGFGTVTVTMPSGSATGHKFGIHSILNSGSVTAAAVLSALDLDRKSVV